MRIKQEDTGYWAGWFVAFGIAAAIFIYAVWQGPTLESVMCKQGEQDCFRQWVSSLGAWVAIPSLIYAARQVSQAAKYHRQTMHVTYRPLRALAYRASYASVDARDQSLIIRAMWRPENVEDFRLVDIFEVYEAHINELRRTLGNKVFDRFEDLIFLEPGSIAEGRDMIENMAPNDTFHERADHSQTQYKILRQNIRQITNFVITWMTECNGACESMLDDAEIAAGDE